MSKILIFMRHGKAADISGYASDFERPLVNRGREEAAMAAEKLEIIGIVPDTIIASPAARTQETAQSVCGAFGRDTSDYETSKSLYGGDMKDYLHAAGKSKGKVVMLIGHNPDIGRLAVHFSKNEISNFPTSACAAFQFETEKPELKSLAELLFYDLRK